MLDSVETIAASVRDMSDFLRTSDLTESRAFIRSFVKEIAVKPGTAMIRYTIPTPPDSPIGGRDVVEVGLPEPVINTVSLGTPGRTRTPNLRIRRPLLYPLSYRGTVIADQYRPF